MRTFQMSTRLKWEITQMLVKRWIKSRLQAVNSKFVEKLILFSWFFHFFGTITVMCRIEVESRNLIFEHNFTRTNSKFEMKDPRHLQTCLSGSKVSKNHKNWHYSAKTSNFQWFLGDSIGAQICQNFLRLKNRQI